MVTNWLRRINTAHSTIGDTSLCLSIDFSNWSFFLVLKLFGLGIIRVLTIVRLSGFNYLHLIIKLFIIVFVCEQLKHKRRVNVLTIAVSNHGYREMKRNGRKRSGSSPRFTRHAILCSGNNSRVRTPTEFFKTINRGYFEVIIVYDILFLMSCSDAR